MPEITRAALDELPEVLANWFNSYGAEIREDYSGRAMYGETCIGVVVENDCDAPLVPLALLKAMTSTGTDFDEAWQDVCEIAGSVRTDSMGMGTIVYFADTSVREDED